MILSILAFIWGYRKGKATGRNPWLWSIICGLAFLGTQFATAIVFGLAIGIGVAFFGWDDQLFEKLYYVIQIVAIVASIVALLLVFRFLDRIPQEPVYSVPPAPPRFDNDEGP
jgi:ABC-type nitrate/sulfonate/bicarbonate transport system permease component